MAKITKKEIIASVADETMNTKKDVEEIVNAFLNNIKDQLVSANDVDLNGFGKFEVKTRAARKGINPLTKEPIDIPESKNVGFKSAKALKEQVNN